ncbi:unnamed protein product [Mycena citricolor]|uniref:MYND-type domain-containing protein n=1 Tax=Mycena citricolor TaxID=2018698 RepID=A0AAD2H8S8_9AGAR|nr:unnamed protein product [Mycena citricolor]
MHPSLAISNVAKLPLLLKAHARAVLTALRTRETPDAVRSRLNVLLFDISAADKSLNPMTPLINQRLVPVFFAVLDPAGIPTILTWLETADEQRRGIVHVKERLGEAAASLRALGDLCQSGLDAGARGDVWTRAWEWISFFDTYRDILPKTWVQVGPMSAKFTAVWLFDAFTGIATGVGSKDARDPMNLDKMPGYRVFLARTWAHYARQTGPDTDEAYGQFTKLLSRTLGRWDSTTFAELGGRDNIAILTCKHIQRLFPRPDTPPTEAKIDVLLHILPVLMTILRPPPNAPMPYGQDRKLRAALLANGITAPLTVLVQAIQFNPNDSQLPPEGSLFTTLLPQVSGCLIDFPAHSRLCESLRAGLLNLFAICVNPRNTLNPRAGRRFVETILKEQLLPGTVYHSVMEQLVIALPPLRKRISKAIEFGYPDLLQEWNSFLQIFDNHACVMQTPKAAEESFRACDYLPCGQLRSKYEVKRCSGCEVVWYCSEICQAKDWTGGGHSSLCSALNAQRNKSPLSRKDRSFLRDIVIRYYLDSRIDILRSTVSYLQDSPRSVFPITKFTFIHGMCGWQVVPATKMKPNEMQAILTERSRKSPGTMHIHVVIVRSGDQEIEEWIPFRMSDARLTEGLGEVALRSGLTQGGSEDVDYVTRQGLALLVGRLKGKMAETHQLWV